MLEGETFANLFSKIPINRGNQCRYFGADGLPIPIGRDDARARLYPFGTQVGKPKTLGSHLSPGFFRPRETLDVQKVISLIQ
jgi:hypothetical protein